MNNEQVYRIVLERVPHLVKKLIHAGQHKSESFETMCTTFATARVISRHYRATSMNDTKLTRFLWYAFWGISCPRYKNASPLFADQLERLCRLEQTALHQSRRQRLVTTTRIQHKRRKIIVVQ